MSHCSSSRSGVEVSQRKSLFCSPPHLYPRSKRDAVFVRVARFGQKKKRMYQTVRTGWLRKNRIRTDGPQNERGEGRKILESKHAPADSCPSWCVAALHVDSEAAERQSAYKAPSGSQHVIFPAKQSAADPRRESPKV